MKELRLKIINLHAPYMVMQSKINRPLLSEEGTVIFQHMGSGTMCINEYLTW